jgi:hypothetical protein
MYASCEGFTVRTCTFTQHRCFTARPTAFKYPLHTVLPTLHLVPQHTDDSTITTAPLLTASRQRTAPCQHVYTGPSHDRSVRLAPALYYALPCSLGHLHPARPTLHCEVCFGSTADRGDGDIAPVSTSDSDDDSDFASLLASIDPNTDVLRPSVESESPVPTPSPLAERAPHPLPPCRVPQCRYTSLGSLSTLSFPACFQ